ncbi:uncharacterized protein N7477_005721 [Penicillium maclennaniae]|uniref:uncharacterized protein n=1 Tax=Penicillium maclennaniae TaxID=1343394 RepID=UPI0025421FFC|nr:uncharacterized protein N7477_005721 [Penicillium maclennaniae]KAJ5670358.1 hypothetical protein N7477_005721 [Penicillium maclennaniae]
MDELVQDGQKGGHSAAKALIEAARDHVRRVNSNSNPNIHLKIRVYAIRAGLAKTYADTGIVSSTDILSDFIQAHFEHNLRDIHCQHIIFCGSADNGYARVLGPHRGSSRISLVEGPPFPRELRDLASEFETTSFPSKSVIRQYKSRTSHHTIMPHANYASIARTSPLVSEGSSPLTKPPTQKLISRSSLLVVHRNVNGERVDSPLKYSTRAKLEVLKQHKSCNQFHILGSCFYGESCTHKHEPRLANQEVVDLKWIARLSPCSKGLQCNDERCVSGHRCPHETLKGCKFPHEVDTRIVLSL